MDKESKAFLILLILVLLNINVSNVNIVNRIMEQENLEKIEAERYTERVTPIINTQIQYILMSDPEASNVILLSYHNSNHSSQGFSYKYITYLIEKVRDVEDMYGEEFKELSYVSYGEEFSKIHNSKYLITNDILTLKRIFSKTI